MTDFKELKVWMKANKLATLIYQETAQFPSDEKFGIVSQIRRATISISANIAEGCGQNSDAQFGRYLGIAYGSSCELESLLLTSNDLGFLKNKSILDNLVEIKRMLHAFKERVSGRSNLIPQTSSPPKET